MTGSSIGDGLGKMEQEVRARVEAGDALGANLTLKHEAVLRRGEEARPRGAPSFRLVLHGTYPTASEAQGRSLGHVSEHRNHP